MNTIESSWAGDQWHPHVTVASLATRDGRYLLVQETYNGKSVINQPAGHLEKDETLLQAVVRETLEETGWNFVPKFLCVSTSSLPPTMKPISASRMPEN